MLSIKWDLEGSFKQGTLQLLYQQITYNKTSKSICCDKLSNSLNVFFYILQTTARFNLAQRPQELSDCYKYIFQYNPSEFPSA